MTVWKNCETDLLYFGGAADRALVEVRIDEDEIVISYEHENNWVNYRGRNDGTGHYLLAAPEVDGRATLHQFPKGKILEGYWKEDGEEGMWRIKLR